MTLRDFWGTGRDRLFDVEKICLEELKFGDVFYFVNFIGVKVWIDAIRKAEC
jgi:hypothetical protein